MPAHSATQEATKAHADSVTAKPCAEITDADRDAFLKLISTQLTKTQEERIVEPETTYPRQKVVLAVHWHPEFVPMEMIRRRVDKLFPNRRNELIIPTQHNDLTSYGDYAGVEVDCYSKCFKRKVQLLIHFEKSRVESADVFRTMLSYTFKYRASQLFEFIDAIVDPQYEDRLQLAAARAGADEDLIAFVRTYTQKLKNLYLEHESVTPAEAVRNKLLINYFDTLRDRHGVKFVQRAVALLRAVKKVVKANFSPDFFYATEEVIEEVRNLGGGIVIPHPEQFWPILMAEYDVDGYEVWNPQSRDYTEFLINVVNRQNKTRNRGHRPILLFMGDDCHMGEKTKEPHLQDREKASREIGVQPAWDDLSIRKSLIIAGTDRQTVIEAYKERLHS